MGRSIECFMLEDTGKVQLRLRRYRTGDLRCQAEGEFRYCTASSAPIGVFDARPSQVGPGYLGEWHAEEFEGDQRWPSACTACGYVFTDEDHWQVWQDRMWRAHDGRELLDDPLPAGAMFHAPWLVPTGAGPDGLALLVVLPDGTRWHIDGPAYNDGTATGPGVWKREGTPPLITVTPSIQTLDYHGHLTAGHLVD